MLEDSAVAGITGGGIHEEIIGRCAMKARADAIYTWNFKHFTRLGSEIASRVRTP